MVYNITKKYYTVYTNNNEVVCFHEGNSGNCSTTHNYFESDNLQDVIDCLLNNNITSFEIPYSLVGLDIDVWKRKPVFQDKVVRYLYSNPTTENVLVGYEIETDTEEIYKNKLSHFNWKFRELAKNNQLKRPIRCMVKVIDTAPGQLWEAKSNYIYKQFAATETIIPMFRVDENNNIDELGEYYEFYLIQFDSQSEEDDFDTYVFTLPEKVQQAAKIDFYNL